jgi:hypothetical protein
MPARVATVTGSLSTLILQDAELVRHRISPATRITMLSCSYSYSLLAVSQPGARRMPSELVGVAGFEPAASSSRTTQTFE